MIHPVSLALFCIWGSSPDRANCRTQRRSTLRPSLCSEHSEPRTYITKHGTESTMSVANIGRAAVALAIEEIESERARERMEAGTNQYSPVQKIDQADKGPASEKAAAAMSPKDISEATGMSAPNVKYLLGKMVAAGELEKLSYGTYRPAAAA